MATPYAPPNSGLRKQEAGITFARPSVAQKRPAAKGRSAETQSTVVSGTPPARALNFRTLVAQVGLLLLRQRGRLDGLRQRLVVLELGVDDELERRRLFDGQVGRPGALEDPVHVRSSAAQEIGKARAVRHEPPGIDVLPGWVTRGPRSGLLEEFEALRDEFRRQVGQPRDVAARSGEAFPESSAADAAD